jgi:hypothetical protein
MKKWLGCFALSIVTICLSIGLSQKVVGIMLDDRFESLFTSMLLQQNAQIEKIMISIENENLDIAKTRLNIIRSVNEEMIDDLDSGD